jgi:excinuclease ABC subunit C
VVYGFLERSNVGLPMSMTIELTSLTLNKIPLTKENVKNARRDVGIYVFWDENQKPLYVGKSTNLHNRLESYLRNDLETKTRTMIALARYFSTIAVTSEIESLLLEAKLVKENQPKYNIQLKDDKTPLYIKITKDEFPKVVTARKADILEGDTAIYFGPFPSSSTVKMILRLLRRIFPYANHAPTNRPCLYSQLGLCKPCPSSIVHIEDPRVFNQMKREYRKNISYIKLVLSGRMKRVRKTLEKRMNDYAKIEAFEEAKKVRELLEKFDYITQPVNPAHYFLKNPNLVSDIRNTETREIVHLIKPHMLIDHPIRRIECFDIAHLSGTHPTASMVTFIDGESDKTLYRHFKIKQKKGNDDYASLAEVAKRRKYHLEDWGRPDLIIVDGGKGQLGVFMNVLGDTKIPIVGLAKRFETLVIPSTNSFGENTTVEVRIPEGPALNLAQRIRNEAHRFARRLHHMQIHRELLKKE